MTAPETHELHELERIVLSHQRGGGEHARVVVVHDVDPRTGELDLRRTRHRVSRQHGDAARSEQLRQTVIHQLIILIRARSQDHRVAAGLLGLRDDFRSSLQQL